MNREELRSTVDTVRAIESIALLGSVSSTNDLARQIIAECIENEIAIPPSMLIAHEQRSGRGRGSNNWLSPAGAGIYATTIVRRDKNRIGLMPLETANLIASFLTDTFALATSIKWPNDVLIEGRKVAGILIEARFSNGTAYVAIGTGINILKAGPMYATAVSVEEALGARPSLDDALHSFIRKVDQSLVTPPSTEETLALWRARAIHQPGEKVNVMVGSQRTDAEWIDIDDEGRASVLTADGITQIAAGELIRIES